MKHSTQVCDLIFRPTTGAQGERLSTGLASLLAIVTVILLATSTWAASHETVLHEFKPRGTDGANPSANTIRDPAGNFYSTTGSGGTYNAGTVFEISPNGSGGWTEKVLHNFNGSGTDGAYPYSGVTLDSAGNLYGTTYQGGDYGYGIAYELSPNGSGGWTYKKLHNFGSGRDGTYPEASMVMDGAGNLYGTTYQGGNSNQGAVFKLTPNGSGGWTESVVHNFSGTDGTFLEANLIFDGAGNLYGTTYAGGDHGYGTAFEMMPNGSGGWTFKKLHDFGNGTDGATPYAPLTLDAAGNLYGSTYFGGDNGWGTVFELTPNGQGGWSETKLHNFNLNGSDGASPEAVLLDASGNIYGTTNVGGDYGLGTIFEMTPNGSGGWNEKKLHNFHYNGTDGAYPDNMIFDAAGNLYATTTYGGTHGVGTMFQLASNGSGGWNEDVLYNFNYNGTDGAYPYYANLISDVAGNLYGTTDSGGAYSAGAVFELVPNGSGGWTQKLLHSFDFDGNDGAYPYGGLVSDGAGNLYGTTSLGGDYHCNDGFGCGAVFELSPNGSGGWTEKVLHRFTYTGVDGLYPRIGLALDGSGNLYGTAAQGGDYGYGTAFELSPNGSGGWSFKKLHNFGNGTDAANPHSTLVVDSAGNLYGTSLNGGDEYAGTVFELSPNGSGGWTEKKLHNFGVDNDGYYPWAGLILDAAGNLYGTTEYGGNYYDGTVFELSPNGHGGWTEKRLHDFGNGNDGEDLLGNLVLDAAGNLYGTTYVGGSYGYGTAFKLTPNGSGGWSETKLHNFGTGNDGAYPDAGLIVDQSGNLYGTTSAGGGSFYSGTVFEITQ